MRDIIKDKEIKKWRPIRFVLYASFFLCFSFHPTSPWLVINFLVSLSEGNNSSRLTVIHHLVAIQIAILVPPIPLAILIAIVVPSIPQSTPNLPKILVLGYVLLKEEKRNVTIYEIYKAASSFLYYYFMNYDITFYLACTLSVNQISSSRAWPIIIAIL